VNAGLQAPRSRPDDDAVEGRLDCIGVYATSLFHLSLPLNLIVADRNLRSNMRGTYHEMVRLSTRFVKLRPPQKDFAEGDARGTNVSHRAGRMPEASQTKCALGNCDGDDLQGILDGVPKRMPSKMGIRFGNAVHLLGVFVRVFLKILDARVATEVIALALVIDYRRAHRDFKFASHDRTSRCLADFALHGLTHH